MYSRGGHATRDTRHATRDTRAKKAKGRKRKKKDKSSQSQSQSQVKSLLSTPHKHKIAPPLVFSAWCGWRAAASSEVPPRQLPSFDCFAFLSTSHPPSVSTSPLTSPLVVLPQVCSHSPLQLYKLPLATSLPSPRARQAAPHPHHNQHLHKISTATRRRLTKHQTQRHAAALRASYKADKQRRPSKERRPASRVRMLAHNLFDILALIFGKVDFAIASAIYEARHHAEEFPRACWC